jgi:hypothetical protein
MGAHPRGPASPHSPRPLPAGTFESQFAAAVAVAAANTRCTACSAPSAAGCRSLGSATHCLPQERQALLALAAIVTLKVWRRRSWDHAAAQVFTYAKAVLALLVFVIDPRLLAWYCLAFWGEHATLTFPSLRVVCARRYGGPVSAPSGAQDQRQASPSAELPFGAPRSRIRTPAAAHRRPCCFWCGGSRAFKLAAWLWEGSAVQAPLPATALPTARRETSRLSCSNAAQEA